MEGTIAQSRRFLAINIFIVLMIASGICLLISSAQAIEKEPIGFRSLEWGNAPDSKTSPFELCYDKYISSREKLGGQNDMWLGAAPLTRMGYCFMNGKEFFQVYIHTESRDFDELKAAVFKQYGTPTITDISGLSEYSKVQIYKWLWKNVRVELQGSRYKGWLKIINTTLKEKGMSPGRDSGF
ncbi:MAG: hypothetical protein COW90_10465 [Nitrospirae bacterium CG22_combo_CG10-13_8_21_14_all_44_11]|nr:MAG: hypothetical protein COW90_10465 [Nitrospirae bacterium CG22_combo_CG10-13_8_21_14_all_44_11]